MSGFFSGSSSRRRYPNPNMGGKHYRKKGLFGMIPGMGSFSGSGSYSGYGYVNQGYPNQGYPNQGYSNQGYSNQDIRTRGIQISRIRIRGTTARHRRTSRHISRIRQQDREHFSRTHRQRQDRQYVRTAEHPFRQDPSSACHAGRRWFRMLHFVRTAAGRCLREQSSALSAEVKYSDVFCKNRKKDRRLHRSVLHWERALRCMLSCP